MIRFNFAKLENTSVVKNYLYLQHSGHSILNFSLEKNCVEKLGSEIVIVLKTAASFSFIASRTSSRFGGTHPSSLTS